MENPAGNNHLRLPGLSEVELAVHWDPPISWAPDLSIMAYSLLF